MKDLYETTAKWVAVILEKDYHLSASEARQAIEESPLKFMFEKDAEMAAHTSNESWAKDVFNYWSKKHK